VPELVDGSLHHAAHFVAGHWHHQQRDNDNLQAINVQVQQTN
jgi:hypothetical protein